MNMFFFHLMNFQLAWHYNYRKLITMFLRFNICIHSSYFSKFKPNSVNIKLCFIRKHVVTSIIYKYSVYLYFASL